MREAKSSLRILFDKVYRMRRIVAGDSLAAISGGFGLAQVDEPITSLRLYPMIIVTALEQAKSNAMLKAIRTLAFQVAYRFPKIEFSPDELTPNEAVLNSSYLASRLGRAPMGCNALPHLQLALMDYLIGGLGFTYTPVAGGRPTVQYADTLDVLWDTNARFPSDMRWCAVKVLKTRGEWKRAFSSIEVKPGAEDQNLYLTFYYDLDGETGTYHVFEGGESEGGWNGTPLYSSGNPCVYNQAGKWIPVLPLKSMAFMSLPSVKSPVSIAESMLPSQLMVWQADATIRDTIARGAGFWEIRQGEVEDEELKNFEKGEIGTHVTSKSGGAINQRAPMEVPVSVYKAKTDHEQEIIQQSGANPFATGDRVEGVNFAAQVNAIQGQAGLMAGVIAKENSAFWETILQTVLMRGKTVDNQPIAFNIEGVRLEFGPNSPINEFLRPDATPVVSEDTMRFTSKQEEFMMASAVLQQALSLAQLYPGAIGKAYERYLQTAGIKDPARFMGEQAGLQAASTAQQIA